jgi:dipeptidyl aminopeptidase/acylaminoacyl peptidase
MFRSALILAFVASGSLWAQEFVPPADNLIVDGLPPLPKMLVESADRYAESRAAIINDWHPSRREMLVNTRFADTPQIHLVKFPAGARQQLTFFKDSAVQATFEPNKGEYIVFEKDSGGNEAYQLYRYDFASGNITLLTDGKSRHVANAWAPGGGLSYCNIWSHKGDQIAYGKIRPDGEGVVTEFHLVDPQNPSSDRLVAEHKGAAMVSSWSLDDKKLLVMEFFSIAKSNLWLIDIKSGSKTQLTKQDAGESAFYAGGQFSKKDSTIYTVSDKGSEFKHLSSFDVATSKLTHLSRDIPWDVEDIALSPNGNTLAFTTNENGLGVLRLLDVKTGTKTVMKQIPLGVLGDIKWHNNSRDLAFSVSNAQSPNDVYSIDVKTNKISRWTTSETGGLNANNFVMPKLIHWNAFDSRSISGFLYQPPAQFKGPRPVMVVIHGGPESQYRPGYLGRNNYLVNELGIALIYPNIRGSSGFGRSFLALDNGMKREDTYTDIAALFEWIGAQNNLDKNRILVMGGSYGGHMTLAVATRYADKIRAAISVVGISNLKTFLENTESYRRDLRRAEYGDERDPATRSWMESIAPLNNASQITKPLFVVQGYNDPRVPRSEAIQIVDALKKQKTPTWFLMAKDEGHGFGKKKNQDFLFYSTLQFAKEYLLK